MPIVAAGTRTAPLLCRAGAPGSPRRPGGARGERGKGRGGVRSPLPFGVSFCGDVAGACALHPVCGPSPLLRMPGGSHDPARCRRGASAAPPSLSPLPQTMVCQAPTALPCSAPGGAPRPAQTRALFPAAGAVPARRASGPPLLSCFGPRHVRSPRPKRTIPPRSRPRAHAEKRASRRAQRARCPGRGGGLGCCPPRPTTHPRQSPDILRTSMHLDFHFQHVLGQRKPLHSCSRV